MALFHYLDNVQDVAGNAVSNANVTIKLTGTSTLASLYSDSAGTIPVSNPLTTDNIGRFGVYVADGYYDITVSGTNLISVTEQNVLVGIGGGGLPGGGVLGQQLVQGSLLPQWQTKPVVDIRDLGGIGDGATDNTTVINSALTALCPSANSSGGTLLFPPGIFRANGRIVIPSYGGSEISSTPGQTCAIVIRGSGAVMNGAANPIVPNSGTVLDLRYSGGNSKVVSLGMGHLTIEDMTLADFGLDTTWFGLSTNTTVHLNRVGFYGIGAGTSATNDAWHFGGTDITHVLTENAHFAGYGTTVTNCWFNNIARAIYGGAYCNGLWVVGNNIWNSSGYPAGGAMEFYGDVGSPDTGNYIMGNIVEMAAYKYAVYGSHFSGNYLSNDGYDSTATTSAFIRLENSSNQNFITSSQHDDLYPFVTADAGSNRNAIVNAHQSQTSTWTEPWVFTNSVSFSGSFIKFPNTDAEYWDIQPIFGAAPQVRFNHHSNAGADTLPLQIQLGGGVNTEVTLLGNGILNNVVNIFSPGGMVMNPAAGGSFWPIGVGGGIHFDVNTANVGGIAALTITGSLSIGTIAFASLPALANGALMYCSDCTVASPCAGGGTGALAKRVNGAWVCN